MAIQASFQLALQGVFLAPSLDHYLYTIDTPKSLLVLQYLLSGKPMGARQPLGLCGGYCSPTFKRVDSMFPELVEAVLRRKSQGIQIMCESRSSDIMNKITRETTE